MTDLRLVIFDVDGTLVDSRAAILAAFQEAYTTLGLTCPRDEVALDGVGLSLDLLVRRMDPGHSDATYDALIDAYRRAFFNRRTRLGAAALSPLYPGAREALELLSSQDETLLAIATGKSRRGLDSLVEGHGIAQMFQSLQCADDHPSKPNPSMITQALSECGVEPERALIVGDTSFDMDMGRAAGVKTLGVSWGFHPVSDLDADRVIDKFSDIADATDALLGR